jgi:hypothetical protein
VPNIYQEADEEKKRLHSGSLVENHAKSSRLLPKGKQGERRLLSFPWQLRLFREKN